jgi:hypothetical protein
MSTALQVVARKQNTGIVLPNLIGASGEHAAFRFIEFFTVTIRNVNTRTAYGRAAAAFSHCCEEQGITVPKDVQPIHIAAGHSNAKTTGRYDRRNDDADLDEVERIGI